MERRAAMSGLGKHSANTHSQQSCLIIRLPSQNRYRAPQQHGAEEDNSAHRPTGHRTPASPLTPWSTVSRGAPSATTDARGTCPTSCPRSDQRNLLTHKSKPAETAISLHTDQLRDPISSTEIFFLLILRKMFSRMFVILGNTTIWY